MTTTLRIESANPDYCGVWLKDFVEDEMHELEIESSQSYNWIGHVLSHVFLDDDFSYKINCLLIAFEQSEELRKITIKPEGFDEFTIIKE